MGKQLFIAILFLSGITSASAQWSDALVDNRQHSKIAVGAFGGLDFGSNAITSSFAYNFYTGNYIDSALKKQVSSNLKTSNRLGYNFNYGLYAVLYNDTIKKKKVFNFFFALKHRTYFSSTFSNDDFNLAFYGNAMYAGKTAVISPLNITSLNYYQAEIGGVCTNFGGNAQFGAGISFLAGQNYADLNATSANLYTDAYGQYLQLNSNSQVWTSDTSQKPKNLFNGIGASLDIYFRAPYRVGNKNGTVSVSVSDIGFIWWNNRSVSYQKDTSYYYNGIYINSISSLQNTTFHSMSKDSLQNKYFPLTHGGFYGAIPTTLKIVTNTAFTEKFHLQAGFWYLFNANDIGYIYLQADKYFSHGWMGSFQLGYGDYSTINGALMIAKEFKHCKLELAINRLQGLIVPSVFGGAGAFANYVFYFGKK